MPALEMLSFKNQPRPASFSKLRGGLPRGCLVEISGKEAAAQAARFLEENPWMHAAWVEKDMKEISKEVVHRDLNFSRVLFIDGKEDAGWAASSLMRSGHFPVLIYHAPYGCEKELRRFRKICRDKNITMILLRDEPCFAWPIALQMRANHNGLELLRRR